MAAAEGAAFGEGGPAASGQGGPTTIGQGGPTTIGQGGPTASDQRKKRRLQRHATLDDDALVQKRAK